ncbi:MAG: T9SS type A sorting domain-containing protein [Chitinophagaceae bacterium]|nr:T9SS type A sorting domain-containing protein [Chitinophagaceae bacterium]
MKLKIYLGILCMALLLNQNLKAQDSVIYLGNQTFPELFDQLSQGLEKSRIPYATLYDRVYPWSNLKEWTSGATLDEYKLYQSWWDLENSKVYEQERVGKYETMREDIDKDLRLAKIPIVAIHYNFASIDPQALVDGRIIKNGNNFVDKLGDSPYLTHQVCLAGLPISEVQEGQSYQIVWEPQKYFLSNCQEIIEWIQIHNLTTNETFTVYPNQPIAVEFKGDEESKEIPLEIIVHLANQTTDITGIQPIKFKKKPTMIDPFYACSPSNELVASDIPFQGYDENIATTSFADYHIYYHKLTNTSDQCEPILKKPIIVLDGYDPLDKARNYLTFYDQYFKDYETNINLGQLLRTKGYDVVVLNFPTLGSTIPGIGNNPISGTPNQDLLIPEWVNNQTVHRPGRDGGADYVERNAFILVKLIQELNAKLLQNGSTEQLTIVGPSMGGQISRYALAYMEKHNMNHNTRLWVSFDSPHHGANIPLSLQDNIWTFGNLLGNSKARDTYKEKLQAKAARQFLIEQRNELNGASSFFQTYYANAQNNGVPGSNGYPMNLRKISLVNGSGTGINEHPSGAMMMDLYAHNYYGVVKVWDKDWFMPNTNQTAQNMYLKIKVLGMNLIAADHYVTNLNPRGSMDVLPGGLHNSQKEFFDAIDPKMATDGYTRHWYTYTQNHCFIPLISSLGFNNTNVNWSQSVDDRNLVCTSEIPFDNYYTPTHNEEHSYFSTASAHWLEQEVDFGTQGCPSICAMKINGQSSLCMNQIVTFNLDYPVPSGMTYTWSVSSGLQIVSFNNSSVTVQAIGGNPNAWVKIIITPKTNNLPCGADKEIIKDINSGNMPNYTITFASNGGNSCYYHAQVSPALSVNTYEYSDDGGFTWYGCNPNAFGYFIPLNLNGNQAQEIDVKITNPCSGITYLSKTFNVQHGPMGCTAKDEYQLGAKSRNYRIDVYPNPSRGDWNLILYTYLDRDIEVSLTDMQGKKIWQKSYRNLPSGNLNIPNTNLAPGAYMIQVKMDGQIQTAKAIKM